MTATVPAGSAKAAASALRRTVIERFTGPDVRAAVATMGPAGQEILTTLPLLSPEEAGLVLECLRHQDAWAEEKWLIFPDGAVRMCSDEEFAAAVPENRFSYNDCLRKLPEDAYPVRALLSAMESPAVAAALTEAYGSPIGIKGIDMARYTEGHYLRRHADTFDERLFGFIFFLAADWTPGSGGELVVEAPSGEAHVAYPRQGDVALLRIRPGFQHEVCQVRSSNWIRYVVSVHFGAR